MLLDRTKLIRAQSQPKDAEFHHPAGSVEWMLEEYDQANAHYRQAVHLALTEAEWRSEFAKLLLEQSKLVEAQPQASCANKLVPENNEYERLLRAIINQRIRTTNE